MKLTEREMRIIEQLEKSGAVSVPELAELFCVSLVTIRKDLQRLEEDGQLVRTCGGAVSCNTNVAAKHRFAAVQRIATAVLESINEDDSLILNAGTTTRMIAKKLCSFHHLKIITNSISIAKELSLNGNFQLILLGGGMNADAVFTYGRDAIAQLEQYKVEKLILSASGVSLAKGITTHHMECADLLRKMVERSKEVISVADDSKIGFESFYHVGDALQIGKLYTNTVNRPEVNLELNRLQEAGVEIIRC